MKKRRDIENERKTVKRKIVRAKRPENFDKKIEATEKRVWRERGRWRKN